MQQAWNIIERAVKRGRERKKESLDEYYETLSEEELANIEAVSMYRSDPFISSTMEHIPDGSAKIVFDRFHVMKHVNETRKENIRNLWNLPTPDDGTAGIHGSFIHR